ncbi:MULTISPECIES: hypothetical protein [Niastella]|uniref:Cell surface protein SprA n=1 Tax=Niastella soli TaxID=2821487 RepID=A0ABS3Z0I0_9BACT|nr:hypothetical protein [Niastella soli]MBO9203663.1 hypothetical protein [Niastella soli]
MIGKNLILCFCFCIGWLLAVAQSPRSGTPGSNLRKKVVSAKQPAIQLDSLSLVPGTVRIAGIPDSLYEIDFVNARLTWKQLPPLDSVIIHYRVFRTRLNAAVSRMQYDSIMNNFMGQPFVPDYVGIGGAGDGFFNFGNINYNGSFGRGISFGNSQDAVFTSNLNLQLSGYLADSIEIVAAITDNNIPIQPDGTTQQLNEFDRIFLQFKKKNWQLSLGDIDIRQQQSYFLSFYKRLQGVAFETTAAITDSIINKTMVSGSIAKGKFTRNTLTVQEGNQGPYRLQGANNEFYFVVLANTERVYIDGVLMQRGEDRDYVINYNTAEISFTPKQMVTKDKRIVVEFEYADRNYLNSNIYVTNETDFNRKVKLKLGYFSNSDAKSSPINQSLDADQKNFLRNLGDSINQAYYPYAAIDTFKTGTIQYKKIDTVYNGGNHDSVFVYSTNPDDAKYSLSFVEVGVNQGNYIPDLNGANGKVYRWVQPVNGVKQGNFEPAMFLVTPKKQQVANMGVEYNITKNMVLNTEVATSNYDVNTFSNIDKDNDRGYAAKVDFKNTIPVKGSKKEMKFTTDLGYEYVDSRFKPLERLRNIEFTRDWGLPLLLTTPVNENIVTAGMQLSDKKNNSLRYQFTEYNRGSSFTGLRHSVTHVQDIKGWMFNNQFTISNIDATDSKGYFWRPTISISRQFPKLKHYIIGGAYAVEHNAIRDKLDNTMEPQSFSFTNASAYLKSNPSNPNHWGVNWFTRTNSYPLFESLVKTDRSQNVTLTGDLTKDPRHQFRFTSTYRKLQVLDSTLTGQLPEESLLGRAEYQVNVMNGLMTGNLLYEVGAGQEQKRDYSYLEVPAGQGQYTWIDYNSDGIQQLNEFEVALFQDQAKFIRIFTPSNVYVKASYNTFNYSINLNPRAAINLAKATGVRKFISKINLQSSLQINKKEVADQLVQFNPFKAPLNDTSLLTLNKSFVNTFSFNRFSPKWGFDVTNSRNDAKSLLTYGYESHKLDEWTVRTRWNISKMFALELTGKSGLNQLITSNAKFDNRNYLIKQYSAEPRFTLTKGTNFRMGVGYKYSDKNNEQGSQEKMKSNSLTSDVKYNILQSTSINAKFTYSEISFTSYDGVPNPNSSSGYIILEGLQPGKNYLWTLDLTKRLMNNLEFSMQYEGRKPGTSRIVHIGRASIRALL